jgi:tRNA threonylcarbamoyladenosine biosynthesis protein TsaE
MKHISKSVVETAAIAQSVLTSLRQKKQATVLALYGDLGSGKTTFTQELGKLLGIEGSMQSPTFVIMKKYQLSDKNYKQFYHIDAYRLGKPEELSRLGWEEIVSSPENLIAIEWAERAEDLLPKDCVRIHFKFIDETAREIVID